MFDKVETKTKTAFTKEYNKQHKDITKMPGGKKGKNTPNDKTEETDKESESD